ncbi:hypothetical protein AB0K49_16955 [Streptomyces decoyicus]|uniref:hypothetical protein n=1 Tax=Streptomyces decoyicus TaxID=249567 RepID=UPI00345CE5DC
MGVADRAAVARGSADFARLCRIVVYTPADEESRELTEALRGIHDPLTGCPEHLRPASLARAELERRGERSGGASAERSSAPAER